MAGDLERSRSSCGEGEREADFGRSSFPFSIGDAERLRDFLLTDGSFERLLEPRSDFGFERLLDRDLRLSERERDLWLAERLRDFRVRERERDFLERDLAGDFEWDFLLDLERDLRPDFERERERDLERLRELLLLRLLLRERRLLRDLDLLPE